MATYVELFGLKANDDLRNRIFLACVVAAETIRIEAVDVVNHANRMAWAKAVFANPHAEAERMLWAVLAQNKALTLAQITSATDPALQTAVNAAVNVFATV